MIFLILFALFMVLHLALSDNVSTKPGLKIFRDEYKSVTAACLDLGFAKKSCNAVSFTEKKVVAFDVRLNHHVNNLATNGRVVFGTVYLKKGKGYDNSGIFSAPASGMYVFYWTILTLPGKIARTSIFVNGKIKSWNHCSVSNTYEEHCSKMTVVKLKEKDNVWIGVYNGPANIHTKFTSFSGHEL